jgi:hypothetical protein
LFVNLDETVEEEECDAGAISYSLPCPAVYNRTIHNEIKRLEIENYNKKLLELYENPLSKMNLINN